VGGETGLQREDETRPIQLMERADSGTVTGTEGEVEKVSTPERPWRKNSVQPFHPKKIPVPGSHTNRERIKGRKGGSLAGGERVHTITAWSSAMGRKEGKQATFIVKKHAKATKLPQPKGPLAKNNKKK